MNLEKMESLLIEGDLSKLNADEKLGYYKKLCESLGLNPLTKPFEYVKFQGKMILYARKDCTEQLRKIHGISLSITSREVLEGCYVVTVKATDKTGRTDESTGAVWLGDLKGEARANAILKSETKAKRRVTLSICGLGMLDENEIETIPGAVKGLPAAESSLKTIMELKDALGDDKRVLLEYCKSSGVAKLSDLMESQAEELITLMRQEIDCRHHEAQTVVQYEYDEPPF